MRIKATLVTAKDLQPGDLFSTRGQEYWDSIDSRLSVGESVYIRTRIDAFRFPDALSEVYKIEIEQP